jgi:probable selenium-dependent hydroxylase accessory protein YqeC
LISLVGAGGKTSLMFTLAEELAGRPGRVVTTTTTKIFPPREEESPWLVTGREESFPLIREGLRKYGRLTWAAGLGPQGKLLGVSLSDLSRLWSRNWLDYLIVEADGSAQRPLKAPREQEPVVPSETTLFLSLLGLSALGRPLNRDSSFQAEGISRLTGFPLGALVTAELLIRLAAHPLGGRKGWTPAMRAVCVLNQSDAPADPSGLPGLAEGILRRAAPAFERVVLSRLKPERRFTVIRL